MFQSGGCDPRDCRFEIQQVVVPCWSAESDFALDDDEEQPQFFHSPVVSSLTAEEFRASDLKPGQVVRVVEKAHGVSLAVANSQYGCMLPVHEFLGTFEFFRWDQ